MAHNIITKVNNSLYVTKRITPFRKTRNRSIAALPAIRLSILYFQGAVRPAETFDIDSGPDRLRSEADRGLFVRAGRFAFINLMIRRGCPLCGIPAFRKKVRAF